jgi:hypothetical protein
MYVAPTPFALAEGTAHRRTLILPEDHPVDDGLIEVGTLTRREVDEMVVAYSFDLRVNEIATTKVPNPSGGKAHIFKAYRVTGDPVERVSLRERSRVLAALTSENSDNDDEE